MLHPLPEQTTGPSSNPSVGHTEIRECIIKQLELSSKQSNIFANQ